MDDFDRLSDSQLTKMTNEILQEVHCCRAGVNEQLAVERVQLLREIRALSGEINELRKTIEQLEREKKEERDRRQTVERELMWAQKKIVELESK